MPVARSKGHTFNMNENGSKNKEAKIIKFFFWAMVVPIMFAVFMRLFFVLFYFIYARLLAMVFGADMEGLLALLSVVTSVAFTIGVIAWTYKQLKAHIIKG